MMRYLLVVLLFLPRAVVADTVPAAPPTLQPALTAFTARLPAARRNIEVIAASADAAAERIAANPGALINPPNWELTGFPSELSNRAGGLSNAYPTNARPTEATPHDVVLFSVRSWAANSVRASALLKYYKSRNWLIIVFASEAGKPIDAPIDFLIDNGAASGDTALAPTNALVNSMQGWIWCCEFVAAMSRRGKCPGILRSVSYPDAEEHNNKLQRVAGGRQSTQPISTSIPAGQLGELYLQRIEWLAQKLASTQTQSQLQHTADVVAKRLQSGKRVIVSGIGHLILAEIHLDTRVPWKVVSYGSISMLDSYAQPGDLLFWIGYLGMNSAYEDFAAHIKKAGVDLTVTLAPDQDPMKNAPDALARIDQYWELGDSEVPAPCYPDRMAPLSGINATLVFRMLDDEVAARLAAAPPPVALPPKAVKPAPPGNPGVGKKAPAKQPVRKQPVRK